MLAAKDADNNLYYSANGTNWYRFDTQAAVSVDSSWTFFNTDINGRNRTAGNNCVGAVVDLPAPALESCAASDAWDLGRAELVFFDCAPSAPDLGNFDGAGGEWSIAAAAVGTDDLLMREELAGSLGCWADAGRWTSLDAGSENDAAKKFTAIA